MSRLPLLLGALLLGATDCPAAMYPSNMHGLRETLRANSYDTATQNVFTAMGSPQPSAGRKALYSTMIKCLETSGAYGHMDWFGFFAAEGGNQNQALVNFANPNKYFTITGSGSFASGTAWVGNGSNGYLSFGELLSAGGNYTLNTGTIGVWWNGTAIAGSELMGTMPSASADIRYSSSTSFTGRVNGSTSIGPVTFANEHHLTLSRTDASTIYAYANGVQKGSAITNAVDASLPTQNGSAGTARGIFSAMPVAVVYSGNLSAGEIAATDACVRPALTAVGAQ